MSIIVSGGTIQQRGTGNRGQMFLWFPDSHGKHSL